MAIEFGYPKHEEKLKIIEMVQEYGEDLAKIIFNETMDISKVVVSNLDYANKLRLLAEYYFCKYVLQGLEPLYREYVKQVPLDLVKAIEKEAKELAKVIVDMNKYLDKFEKSMPEMLRDRDVLMAFVKAVNSTIGRLLLQRFG